MNKIKVTILLILGAAFSASAAQTAIEATQTVDTRDYILTVSSPYGEVTFPDGGVSTNNWHSKALAIVDNPIIYEPDGKTLHDQTGFSGEGISPTSGSGSSAWVMLTNVTSTLVWTWKDSYWVTWAVSGLGEVQPINMAYSGSGAWCQEGESHHLRAVPDYGWLLTGWSGGVTDGPSATDLYFTPTAPISLLASFSDDPDGDGLLNTNEWAIGSSPWLADTDGDNFDDAFEFANGLSPTVDSSPFVTHIQDNPDTYGLYSSNAVLDVAIGQTLFEVQGTTARLNLQLEQSDDLESWTDAGDPVEWTLPLDPDKKFFRVRAE